MKFNEPVRVAILDDYQRVATTMADWTVLNGVAVVAFHEHISSQEELVARLRPFHVVVAMRERTPFSAGLLRRLTSLRLLVTTGMNNPSIDLRAAESLGITVCGTSGVVSSTPELVWALILALVRHIPTEDRSIRAGGWQTKIGMDLDGSTLGILGLGRIGSRVAAIGRTFGMKIIAWSENLTLEAAQSKGARRVERATLFRESDILSIHLVLSERTRGLVGRSELALMKSSAFLVNTSRGAVVDETALVSALSEGTLAGAALDVFEEEPLPPASELRRLANAVLTPHIGYVTERTYRTYYSDALEDIRSFLDGQPLRVLRPT